MMIFEKFKRFIPYTLFKKSKQFPPPLVLGGMETQPKLLTDQELDRLIEMAWEDRTPFEAIKFQFGLTQGEVIKIMRRELKRSSFNLWRKRVNQGDSIKHLKKRPDEVDRFKCNLQRSITFNKISKR
jgi:uncharacterized protein (TIGR03643 family)